MLKQEFNYSNNRFIVIDCLENYHVFLFKLNQQLKQNKDLNDELRHVKLESTDLQRSLTDYHLTSRERDRLQDSVGELEVCI